MKKKMKKTGTEIKWRKLCLHECKIAGCRRVQTSESCEMYALFDLRCKTPVAQIHSFRL